MKFYLMLLLLASTMAAYSASLYAPFVFDDNSSVTGNPEVLMRTPIPIHGMRWITTLSYRLDYWHSGLDVKQFHMTNLALHILNVLLVASLLMDLNYSSLAALFGAAIFALHPLQSEAVIYISGRSELLAATFGLIAFRAYLKGRFVWASLAFIGACFSKESAAALLLVGGFMEIAKRGYSTEACVAGLSLILLLGACMLPGLHLQDASRSWPDHLLLQSAQLGRYALMLIAPIGQTIDHDAEVLSPAAGMIGLFGFVLAGAFVWESRTAGWALGLAWAGLLVLPRLLINIPEFMAEHHLYLPMVGIAMGAAAIYDTLTVTKENHSGLFIYTG